MTALLPLSIGHWFSTTASSGSLLLAVPVALVAGLVSFFSPCVVPLLPGYLSYMTGLSGADLGASRRGRMLLGSLLFVLGFTLVWVLVGAAFGALGEWVFTNKRLLTIILGGLTIVLGIGFMGAIPAMQRDVRVHKVPAVGVVAAPLLGVLFGLGWSPCVGPTLSAIMGLSSNEGNVSRGVFLAICYCLGLGIPFILVAVGFGWVSSALGFLRRHVRVVSTVGGMLLIGIGVLLVSGEWNHWMNELRANVGPASGFEI